ncbi:hypothetical protein P689_122235 [Candidatus Riesia pediculischaeffi PTSU]|uniref:Uncharacterized protein n=1 Tax=Candidatus Riesia pediculischaeffi PTSU TaxID=1401651 RepID=A0A0C1V7E0_9ENTR|nr:hypothetical protein P689_122235 [Candidatus Riesia pediculischaeffi PTSU]
MSYLSFSSKSRGQEEGIAYSFSYRSDMQKLDKIVRCFRKVYLSTSDK